MGGAGISNFITLNSWFGVVAWMFRIVQYIQTESFAVARGILLIPGIPNDSTKTHQRYHIIRMICITLIRFPQRNHFFSRAYVLMGRL